MTGSCPSRQFPPDHAAVGDARTFVVEQLRIDPARCLLLATAVGEVATNAVVHARTPFTVTVGRRGELVHVEVADGSPELPVPKAASLQAPTGLGLRIVDEISTRWGAEATPQGKTVWFDIDVHEAASG